MFTLTNKRIDLAIKLVTKIQNNSQKKLQSQLLYRFLFLSDILSTFSCKTQKPIENKNMEHD